MDQVYDFDAPKFVDFMRFAADGEGEDDTDAWFDHRTENGPEPGLNQRGTSEPTDGSMPKKPLRTAVSLEKPARVRVQDSNRSTCPSPPKQSKQDGNSTSPSANTRSKTKSNAGGSQSNKTSCASGLNKAASRGLLHGSTSNLHKTTEELELEKISAMRAETARARKLAQESCKKALSSRNMIPLRSAKQVTMPEAFTFNTDNRLKRNIPTVNSGKKVKDFACSLRDTKASLSTKSHNILPTKPQPFKLTHCKSSAAITKFVSDAEKTAKFSKMTPQRFRSVPIFNGRAVRDATKPAPAATRQSPRLTVAKSPGLTSKTRARPVNVPTREEEEAMEYEKHQKEQFKAHPVNQRVLRQPNLGVPKVEARPLTIPSEFGLTRRRSMSTGDLRAALEETEESHHRFQAKPVNPKIFQQTLGVRLVEPAAPTVPESPAFALKNRIRPHREPARQEEPQRIPRANRLPYEGLPFKPKVDHKYTVPEPFQVEERSKEMLTRKEQKIQHVLEEEKKAHEFYASCLPSLSPDQLPPKLLKPATKPAPFELYVDKRGKDYQEQFQAKQLEEERRLQKKAVMFKAGPNSIIQKKAFQPQASTKPLTEIDGFQLNTDIRAASREMFEQHLKEKEAQFEAVKRQRVEKQEEEEKAAISKLRKEAVHVATGIKKYKPQKIKPSDLPLTQAQTPKFSNRSRVRHFSQ